MPKELEEVEANLSEKEGVKLAGQKNGEEMGSFDGREISISRRESVSPLFSYLRPSPRTSAPVLTQQRPQHLVHR